MHSCRVPRLNYLFYKLYIHQLLYVMRDCTRKNGSLTEEGKSTEQFYDTVILFQCCASRGHFSVLFSLYMKPQEEPVKKTVIKKYAPKKWVAYKGYKYYIGNAVVPDSAQSLCNLFVS